MMTVSKFFRYSCRFSVCLAALLGFFQVAGFAQSSSDVWERKNEAAVQSLGKRTITPDVFLVYGLNRNALKQILGKAPLESSSAARANEVVLEFPMPDGTLQRFRIVESSIMEPGLAAKFPELKTYSGQGIDDPTATVRFDLMPSGFHSQILSASGTVLVDPYAAGDVDNYISYYKRDAGKSAGFICHFGDAGNIEHNDYSKSSYDFFPDDDSPSLSSGTNLKTYRLALAADGEYTAAVGGGTVSGGLAAAILIMNRVNGIYERDLAIRMVLVDRNDAIIYTDAATDPYTNTNPNSLLTQNQANLDSVIGTENYDIGHVFTTGGGGLAGLGVTCRSNNKARGETGLGNPVGDAFAVDYVAHELGHQFGGNHTFNANDSNRATTAAYETGSGVTIMGYAGVLGAQDLALHSIDTFHIRSLEEIVAYKNGSGNVCGTSPATGNSVPFVNGQATFTIPRMTPFSLTASATDANNDVLTYDWQEYDRASATNAIPNTDSDGMARPIFRPYLPTTSGTRVFPSLTYILNNANVPPSTYNCGRGATGCLTGELLPAISRTMNFQVIARDNRANGGGFNTAMSSVVVDGNSGPFVITSQSANATFIGNKAQTVTWNVANTTAAPVSAANVKISLSTDGGQSFPTVLSASTPNDGSESVLIPNTPTTQARIKIEAVGNIFFDINNANFTIVAQRTVTNTLNNGAGSLRQTVTDANATTGDEIISFNIPNCPNSVCSITLTDGEIVVNNAATAGRLTISNDSASQLSISGNNTSRVFSVSAGGNLTLDGVTVTGGNGTGTTNTSLNGNGGGIYNTGALTLTNSVIYGNTASLGGAIYNNSVLNLTNVTISGNSVASGSKIGGAIYNAGTVTAVNNTITNNSAQFEGGVAVVGSGVFNIRNTIIAGNTATDASPDVNGNFTSQGNNLIGKSNGANGFTNGTNGDRTGTIAAPLDARLLPLGFYGGRTLTHALNSGSPAINNGTTTNAPTTDQRSANRIGAIDIGAFELNATSNGGTYEAVLPFGKENVTYNTTLLSYDDSVFPNLTFAVTGGALPSGVTLVKTASVIAAIQTVSLTGTPTQRGSFDFAITTSDGTNSNVTNYTMFVATTTAAGVSVSGRVTTANSKGLTGATVTLTTATGAIRTTRTGANGRFNFANIASGETIILSVKSKRYQFEAQALNINEDSDNVIFRATQP